MHARCAVMLALGACAFNGDDQPAPRIGAIAPDRAAAGAIVTIEGEHFCPAPDPESEEPPACDPGGLVEFGGQGAVTLRWTDVAIDAEVPLIAPGRVDVIVSIGGRRGGAVRFEVTP